MDDVRKKFGILIILEIAGLCTGHPIDPKGESFKKMYLYPAHLDVNTRAGAYLYDMNN